MRRKSVSTAISAFVALISYALPKYLEFKGVITQQNAYWLLYAIYIGAFIVVCVLLWGYWPTIKRIRVQITLSGQVPSAKVPPQENKLAIVAKAIMEAKEITPVGKDVPVYITDSNGLNRILPQEIKGILVKMQDDERVITVKSFPDWLLPDEPLRIVRQPKAKAVATQLEVSDSSAAAQLGYTLPSDWKLKRSAEGDALLSPSGNTFRLNPDGSIADKRFSRHLAELDPSKNHFVVDVLAPFDKWYKAKIKK